MPARGDSAGLWMLRRAGQLAERTSRDVPKERGGSVVSAAHQLLTADDLAERWQVPKSHVYRLTREGLIPAVRLGRYYRYRLEDIEKFEAEGGTGRADA